MKDEYPINRICNVLNIKRRSYYKWIKNNRPIINNYDESIKNIILEEHNKMRKSYGTLRLKEHIQRKFGIILNHKLIRRYKQSFNITVVVRKPKPLLHTRAEEKNLINKAPYVVECDFKANEYQTKLSSDVSYITCTDGRLYLSAVKDLFNKEIVSYSVSENNDTKLIINSYKNLKLNSKAIINTDQGAVYFSYEYVKYAEKYNFTRSMSHKGRCWENSPIENWFSQLKQECLYQIDNLTKKEAIKAIKKYVQWYNTERIQKSLGYLSPTEYLQKCKI